MIFPPSFSLHVLQNKFRSILFERRLELYYGVLIHMTSISFIVLANGLFDLAYAGLVESHKRCWKVLQPLFKMFKFVTLLIFCVSNDYPASCTPHRNLNWN